MPRRVGRSGAVSVEVLLDDHGAVIISATRYLPADVDVVAVVTGDGVLQVLCTRPGLEPVIHARVHRVDRLYRAAGDQVRGVG